MGKPSRNQMFYRELKFQLEADAPDKNTSESIPENFLASCDLTRISGKNNAPGLKPLNSAPIQLVNLLKLSRQCQNL